MLYVPGVTTCSNGVAGDKVRPLSNRVDTQTAYPLTQPGSQSTLPSLLGKHRVQTAAVFTVFVANPELNTPSPPHEQLAPR